jgi:hypothetical protein
MAPNDACANAIPIGTLPFSDVIDTSQATANDDADRTTACTEASPAKTVWYRYTPLADGAVTIEANADDYAVDIAVYEGTCLGTLADVDCANADDSYYLAVQLNAGRTYLIALRDEGPSGRGGTLYFDVRSVASACSPSSQPTVPHDESHVSRTESPACPFECCCYSTDEEGVSWRVVRDSDVFATPSRTASVVGQVRTGERIRTLTGLVRTLRIGASRVSAPDASCADLDFQSGDCLALLHYVANDYWKVWKDGHTCILEPDGDYKTPRSEWWVKVRTTTGTEGWVLERISPYVSTFNTEDRCCSS